MPETASAAERVIEPPKGWRLPDFRELWNRRDLIYFLCRRDIAVRYKQAVVGALWAVLQPVFLALIFALVFGLLVKVPSAPGIPYPLFVVVGFIMWLYFSTALSDVSLSAVANNTLISRVYFPRLAIPLAAVAPPTLDFLFGIGVAVLAGLLYGFEPTLKLLLVPALLALTMIAILGPGLWLAALNVRYRDVIILLPFIIQVGFFLTPVVYPFNLVPDNLQAVYVLNPVAGIMELYRWILLPIEFPFALLGISIGVSLFLFVTGAMYYRKAEQDFADVI